MAKIKEPVKLRGREQASGRTSLYLDISMDGRRKREHLKLYLVTKPRTPEERAHNERTRQLAEAVKAQRVIEVQNGRFGFEQAVSREMARTDVSEWIEGFAQTRVGTRRSTYLKLAGRVEDYRAGTRFGDLSDGWVRGFVSYLGKTGLAQNTQWLYYSALKAVMRQARRAGYLSEDIFEGVKSPAREQTERVYLTLEELQSMAEAQNKCKDQTLARAFLFSCLSGLRRSDVRSLKWGDVHEEAGGVRIVFRQQKTGGLEYLDLSPQAVEYLGERGADGDAVFDGFVGDSWWTGAKLREWAHLSGVHKHITYHSSRHTFAVLMLSLGADIYTTSKLLGHSSLATTQIYAKVLDKKKQEAVRLIPSLKRRER